MCTVDNKGSRNLSQKSLISPSTLQELRNLPTTHPKLYTQLSADESTPHIYKKERRNSKKQADTGKRNLKLQSGAVVELVEDFDEEEPAFGHAKFDDACDVPVKVVIESIVSDGNEVDGFVVDEEGRLCRAVDAEEDERDQLLEQGHPEAAVELGCRKRVKHPSRWYTNEWERNDGPDDDD